MKAMILAAGKGERMRPLTEVTPKPLLTIAGTPLIIHHLQTLAAAGIKDVVINTWYLGEQIVELVGTGARFGLNIQYSMEKELMDTGGGINACLSLLGKEPFIVVSADIFTDFSYSTLPAEPAGLAHLIMVDNPPYHANGDFFLDKGKINMHTGSNKYTYGNIAVFRPEFFAGAPKGPFPLRDLLFKHIADDLIKGQYFNGIWHNIGTPLDLSLANQLFSAPEEYK